MNTDGTLDQTFNTSITFNEYNDVDDIAVQGDGKILIGGYFTVPAGSVTYRNIVRLNKNGTIDTTFGKNGKTALGTNDEVTDILLMPDERIMVSGFFSSYSGASVTHVIRLNSKGLLDKTFQPSATLFKSADFQLSPMVADSSNIYVGFTSIYNTPLTTLHTTIYRLKSNGTLDSSYNVSNSANSYVYATVMDSTNHLLIGGSFTAFNGVGKNHIARLTAASTKRVAAFASNTTSFQSQTTTILIAPNPTKGNVYLQTYTAMEEQAVVKIINAQGKQLSLTSLIIPAGNSKQILSLEKYAAGIYFIVVENSKGTQTFKVVKE